MKYKCPDCKRTMTVGEGNPNRYCRHEYGKYVVYYTQITNALMQADVYSLFSNKKMSFSVPMDEKNIAKRIEQYMLLI
jgi:hypothetical protein